MSVQALWVLSWLEQQGTAAAMQPGWTYLFEAVYRINTHVIQYAFEGLVLLSTIGPDGQELASTVDRCQLAAQLAVLLAPSLEGPEAELLARLGQGASGAQTDDFPEVARLAQGSSATAVPSLEGWVLQRSGGERLKLVQAAFKHAGWWVSCLLLLTIICRSAMHPTVESLKFDARKPVGLM
jgi:hypothetical protein